VRLSRLKLFSVACSTISGHKKQVNCCEWSANGNWLATGSMDGLVKLFDIRTMKEIEVWRGQNSEVSSHLVIIVNTFSYRYTIRFAK
jgi:WD40 repeat protein